MPSFLLPGIIWFSGVVSLHSVISESFCRNRRCAGRALAGIKLRPRKSCSKCGFGGGTAARGSTGDCVWQTRVVTRSNTGIFQRSEISIAASVKS